MDTITERVAAQYSKYVYPDPLEDIAKAVSAGYVLFNDPSKFGALIWPEGRPKKELNILVAGCGPNEAAVIAYNNPQCSVLGIDLSEASLAHADFLKAKHHLHNLTVERRDLREIPGQEQFDYIVCSGVLHHMPDPDEGLRALGAALNPRGAAFIMLYGRAARFGVYLLQDVFRRIGVQPSPEGLALVRDTLANLPDDHYANAFNKRFPDLTSDATVVDTFLHVQDQAYGVSDVLAFVRRNGLSFQGWIDNGLYNTDNIKAGSLQDAVRKLPVQDQWAIVEAITPSIDRHSFLVCRPQRDPGAYSISFSGEEWLNFFPVRHPVFAISKERNPDSNEIEVIREKTKFNVSRGAAVLLIAADGRKTITEILEMPALASIPPEQRRDSGRRIFERMWAQGHMFFSRVPMN